MCQRIGQFVLNVLAQCLVLAAVCQGLSLTAQELPSASAMAGRIDELLDDHLRSLGWSAAPQCDDASFLRRASLDLTGHAPSGGEVLRFLRDKDSGKRAKLIDRLLSSPTSASHFADTWSQWLLPDTETPENILGRSNLHRWLRDRFAENLRYDRLVSDLLVANGAASDGPATFYLSLESKPEKIAAKTARVFLGVQLDCAECHDHPFDHWKQREFWGFAAYFARVSANPNGMMAGGGEVIELAEGDVKLPNSEEVVAPNALVKTGLSGIASGTRRQQLSLWLTARENPYLARAAVNRAWSMLFGRGLIEPVDDMRNLESASHPQILKELSDYFTASQYDLRNLFACLARTAAYQRSTEHPGGIAPTASFATMTHKPLTSLQLAKCLSHVARESGTPSGDGLTSRLAAELGKLRGDASQATLGIVQALVTLHGEAMSVVWKDMQSRLLAAINAPHLDTREQIEWLFLCTVNRQPTADELQMFLDFAKDSAGEKVDHSLQAESEPQKPPPASIPPWQSDLLWALINSTEFSMIP